MTSDDADRDAVIRAVAEQSMLGRNEPDRARRRLETVWVSLSTDASYLRCVVAHALADVQQNVDGELRWDLEALVAAQQVPPMADGAVPVARLFPSLHLNLADVYRRLGRTEEAAHHVAMGREALDALDERMRAVIADAFDRVEGDTV